MKKIFVIYLSIIFSFTIVCAQQPIGNLDIYSFNVVYEKDTIRFLKVKDIGTIKPVLVFCQGSLPIPLIIEFSDGEKIITGINNFDYQKISEKYHIIIISPPSIPIIANEADLNNQYAYIQNKNDEHSYPVNFTTNNYLEKHIERLNAVINYLVKQSWVDKTNILLVGHSQGAKIAARTASQNKNVSALGFLSGDPIGRVAQFIMRAKFLEIKGDVSKEQKQERINELYEWWEQSNKNINRPSGNGEDSPRNIVSFSTPIINDLTTLSIPVFVAYGTEDIAAWYCDLLPIDFIREGKSNYKVKPYIGLDHNFMEVDSLGKPIYEKCYWNLVMEDFIKWIENMKK